MQTPGDWDLSAYFPSEGSAEHAAFRAAWEEDARSLAERMKPLAPLSESNQAQWVDAVLRFEDLSARLSHMASYVGALSAADGRALNHQAAQARLAVQRAQQSKLEVALRFGLSAAPWDVFESWLSTPALESAQYFLRVLRKRADSSMAQSLEELAADLGTDGIEAWGRLYERITSSIELEMPEPGGGARRLPLAACRSLLESADRSVREEAFRAGNAALEPWVPCLAAALNHIAGTRISLARRRGFCDALEPALQQARIQRETLTAMFAAIQSRSEVIRRILQLKASRLGLAKLSWFDLGAPMSESTAGLPEARSFEDAAALVSSALEGCYPSLGQFVSKAYRARWVDYSPRPGKRPGAFCTTSPLLGESRIFMTFQGTYGDTSTLAHEMGHAFHGSLLRQSRVLARGYPMTLAESASTFTELLLVEGLSRRAANDSTVTTALSLQLLNDSALFCTDLVARFHFEQAFYEVRAGAEVSPEDLSRLMCDSQIHAVGAPLAPDGTDPLYWASKLHFFMTRISFYNFPYTFGHLLSHFFRQQYLQHGEAFFPRYEQFLRLSGQRDADHLIAEVFDVDPSTPAFWQACLSSVEEILGRVEANI